MFSLQTVPTMATQSHVFSLARDVRDARLFKRPRARSHPRSLSFSLARARASIFVPERGFPRKTGNPGLERARPAEDRLISVIM